MLDAGFIVGSAAVTGSSWKTDLDGAVEASPAFCNAWHTIATQPTVKVLSAGAITLSESADLRQLASVMLVCYARVSGGKRGSGARSS